MTIILYGRPGSEAHQTQLIESVNISYVESICQESVVGRWELTWIDWMTALLGNGTVFKSLPNPEKKMRFVTFNAKWFSGDGSNGVRSILQQQPVHGQPIFLSTDGSRVITLPTRNHRNSRKHCLDSLCTHYYLSTEISIYLSENPFVLFLLTYQEIELEELPGF